MEKTKLKIKSQEWFESAPPVICDVDLVPFFKHGLKERNKYLFAAYVPDILHRLGFKYFMILPLMTKFLERKLIYKYYKLVTIQMLLLFFFRGLRKI